MLTLLPALLLAPALLAGEGKEPPAVPADRLPVLGTVGDLPPEKERLVVAADAKGSVTFEGKVLDLDGLRELLLARADVAREEKDPKCSRLSVVLRVDRDLPWQGAQRLIQECASPAVRVDRIFFAAVPEDGGEEGAIATFIPTDPGIGTAVPDAAPVKIHVKLEYLLTPVPVVPADLFPFLRASFKGRDESKLGVRIEAAPAAPTGDVLATLDAALRWGTKSVEFQGTRVKAGNSLEEEVAAIPAREGCLRLTALGMEVLPPSKDVPRMDPVKRVRGALAGVTGDRGIGAKALEPPVEAVASSIHLPTMGIVDSLPKPNDSRLILEVEADAKGILRLDGKEFALEALLKEIRSRSYRAPKAGVTYVVLRIDRDLPWLATQRLLWSCKDPKYRIYDTEIAVHPEGSADPSAVATTPGIMEPPRGGDFVTVPMKLEIGETDSPAAPGALYPFLKVKHPELEGKRTFFVIEIAPQVSTGEALAAIDAVLRSGAAQILVKADRRPMDKDLAAAVAALPVRKGGLLLTVLGTRVPPPGKDAPAMPAVGKGAGAGSPPGGATYIGLEDEESEFEIESGDDGLPK